MILFAHGAGAGSGHPWMTAWAERLATIDRVTTFDYPYMQRRGKGPPDRLPKLIEAHRARVVELGSPWLIGKSMGSRVGCHVALTQSVPGLVCLGYPLRSPKGALRDEVLLALEIPILFVQGTRDPMGPLDVLDDVRARMRAPSALHVVEGGNHSLVVGKRALKAAGRTQEDVDADILSAIATFIGEVRP